MQSPAELIKMGDRLYGKRGNLLSFWQDVAEQFAPELADYTGEQTLGDEYASDLMTSYPLIIARELTDAFGQMRPADRDWATMEVEGLTDQEGKRWLEWASKTQRRAMYDRPAQFVKATKAMDKDYALMGQGVVQVEVMPDRSSFLYRKWHLRDVAWSDGLAGMTECVHRKWKPTAYELARIFGEKKLHSKVRDHLAPGKDPYCEIECRHIVIPVDMFHGETKFRTKLVSIYVDVDNEHIIEVTGQNINSYCIPRWQTVGGTQYAISPAVLAAMPEARLLQAMTYTMMEAGEKFVRPPLVGVQEAIRGDLDVMAGGITWVAQEYDERMGEVLRPLTQDKSGMPLGLELQQRSELMLRSAMYLDKFNLPVRGPEMTAFEFSQRMQEYVRSLVTLFDPYETEANATLCERTFEVGAMNGLFGPPDSWPDSVRGADIRFRFVSPWRDAQDKQRGQIMREAIELAGLAVSMDPGAAAVLDVTSEFRDALQGIGVQAKSIRSQKDVQVIQQQQAEAAQREQMLASMTQAAGIAKDLGAVAA